MKSTIIAILLCIASVQLSHAQAKLPAPQIQPLRKKNRKYLIFPGQNGHGWLTKTLNL